MSDVTRILSAIEQGDPHAAEQLLPLVYDELRKLAAQRLAQEKPGQTLEATALVHEAYVRLVTPSKPPPSQRGTPSKSPPSQEGDAEGVRWSGRRHFFAAAAEAMRHILVDIARRKRRGKHGGGRLRVELDDEMPAPPTEADQVLALDEALGKLAAEDPQAAAVVKLRYFTGLSVEEAAETLGISRAGAYRHWTFARAWLLKELCGDEPS
jgi:RNA polymerase sigma factor (sigma-70 family)